MDTNKSWNESTGPRRPCETVDVRWVSVLLLTLPSAIAADRPAFVYSLPGLYFEFGVTAAAVDSAGNTYLTGYTYVPIPVTADAYQPQISAAPSAYCPNTMITSGIPFGPCWDAFLIKLDRSGQVVYGTYFGGDGNDVGTSIAIDPTGNIYIGGTTQPPIAIGNETPANNFPVTPGAAFPASDLPSAFVAKFDATGHTLIYSTYIPGVTSVAGLALDGAGNAYIAGATNPSRYPFPATAGALQASPKNDASAGVIAALNASGSALIYATYLSGSMTSPQQALDGIIGIAVDRDGDAYVTGSTAAADFPVTQGAFETTLPNTASPGTGSAAFVAELNPQGNALRYSTFLGGNGSDVGLAIKVDSQGEAWVLGQTSSTNLTLTATPFEPAPDNYFLVHLNADGSSLSYATYFPGMPGGGQALGLGASGKVYVACSVSTPGLPVTPGAFQSSLNGFTNIYIAQFAPDGLVEAATYLGGSNADYVTLIAADANGSVLVGGVTQSFNFPGLTQPLPKNGVATYLVNLFPSARVPVQLHRQRVRVR
jgi:hypothetical protein